MSLLHRKTFRVLGATLILGAVVTGLLLWRHNAATNTPRDTFRPVVAANTLFSFDTTKAPAWRQGPANRTSMAIFKKDTNCFASVELKNGTSNETEELSKIPADFHELGETATAFDPISATFNVHTGPAKAAYQLHPYAISGAGEHGYKTQVYGYVPLEQHYIKVEAYCSDDTTFSQITTMLSAFALKTAN